MKKILILLLLMVSTNIFAWSLFSPKDFEECRDEAAREAKNKDSLHILINSCDEQFPARRKPEGGYEYYSASTDHTIDVSDPKLSKADWVKIKQDESGYQQWLSKTSKKSGLSKDDIDWYVRDQKRKPLTERGGKIE